MDELRQSLALIKSIKAPLKLAIAGNHHFTLDTPVFRKKAEYAFSAFSVQPELMKKEYGGFGEGRQLYSDSDGIVFLDKGIHYLNLKNGAKLAVYASPFTPFMGAGWGFHFQFRRGEHHDFSIGRGVDVVITHGPPKGVLDCTASKQRGGCDRLFSAIAKARPRLHCFGHIHEGWGAKLVAWRGEEASETPSHFSDIDNAASTLIESLSTLAAQSKKDEYQRLAKEGFRGTSHCSDAEHPITTGRRTLFVNAALKSLEDGEAQLPWVVDIELPKSTQ